MLLTSAGSGVIAVCPIRPVCPRMPLRLRVTVAGLRAENESLRALLEDKNAKIAELEAQNAELAQRLARVERLISRNSGNSSMPPSGDDQPGKTPPPRGSGAAGASRASSAARRGRTWRGMITRTGPWTCSRRGTASAALTWTRPLTGARCCRTR